MFLDIDVDRKAKCGLYKQVLHLNASKTRFIDNNGEKRMIFNYDVIKAKPCATKVNGATGDLPPDGYSRMNFDALNCLFSFHSRAMNRYSEKPWIMRQYLEEER